MHLKYSFITDIIRHASSRKHIAASHQTRNYEPIAARTFEGCRESDRRISKLADSRIIRAISIQLSRSARRRGLSATLVWTRKFYLYATQITIQKPTSELFLSHFKLKPRILARTESWIYRISRRISFEQLSSYTQSKLQINFCVWKFFFTTFSINLYEFKPYSHCARHRTTSYMRNQLVPKWMILTFV